MTENIRSVKYEGTYFIVQTIFSSNPDFVRWSDVSKTFVEGWRDVEMTPNRMHGYRLGRW